MSIERTGRLQENIAGIRESAARTKEIIEQSIWKNFSLIDKVASANKREIAPLNKEAQIGEQIFSQEFDLSPREELTAELHEGMEETIGVPKESGGVKVRADLLYPLTRTERAVLLRNPGEEVVIPPYTIHQTTNLGDEKATLTARGIKTGEGRTIKNPDVKEIFNPDEVAVCIATQYKDWTPGNIDLSNETRTRGYLALGLIREAAHHGYRVIIADTGSSNPFLEELKIYRNVTIVNDKDMSNFAKQKKAAIEAASEINGVKYIFRIEPEKVDSITHIPAHVELLLQSQADVVVGKRRSQEFEASYPDYGFTIENETNRQMNEHLRNNGILKDGEEDLDLYSGLIAFKNNPAVVELFTRRFKPAGGEQIDPKILDSWMNAQVYGVVLALHKGLKVKQVEVPFWYAGLQKLNELHPNKVSSFKDKRIMQQKVGSDGVQLLAETLSGKHLHLVQE
ncbi:MAG: hypothetical protein HY044_02970 [Candidatus Woesebacteria bacterium]|nr:MAG: hypothetical protein HY044_02970 [Candidatus Woesebacteria bacterium]